ncbi:hypothetical protein JKY79_00375 [Candidatus Babeliales bacterium]|nr:hypothetical protein [Candidatus Babeliales bacterium]
MQYHIIKALLFCFISIASSLLQASPEGFYTSLTQQIKMETPCTCICHDKKYTFRKCTTCHHHGGKFMPAPHKKASIEKDDTDEK